MNVWTFTGRLGADAELRTTQSGEKVLGFRVANDVGFGDRKTTQWVECSLWGRRADSLAQFMNKGSQVVVSGELTLREFEKRDGTKGAGLAVRVNDVTLTGGGRDENGNGHGRENDHDRAPPAARNSTGTRGSSRPAGNGGGRAFNDDLDDEIPF